MDHRSEFNSLSKQTQKRKLPTHRFYVSLSLYRIYIETDPYLRFFFTWSKFGFRNLAGRSSIDF